jgi:acyl-CoA synthetase (AMP-forming)/AMP-acid ligase II
MRRPSPRTIEPPSDAVAVLQPTSGTTGSLKLVQLSHRNLLANAMQVAVWMGARDGQERVLTVLPMFHVYGLTTGLINPMFGAATVILLTRFDPAQTLDVLERERPVRSSRWCRPSAMGCAAKSNGASVPPCRLPACGRASAAPRRCRANWPNDSNASRGCGR